MPLHWRNVKKDYLDAQFLHDVCELLENSPYDWYVTEAYRSLERSNKLYDEYKNGVVLYDADGKTPLRHVDGTIKRGKKGVRAAPGGKSAHNFGLAIDVALDGDSKKPGLQMSWDIKMPGWLWLKQATLKHPRLTGGWRFHDWPHIERYRWKDFVGWRKVYEDNLRAIANPKLYACGIPV